MKTDDLILALAADNQYQPSLDRRLALYVASSLPVSLVLFAVSLGLRKDLGAALLDWRFEVKLAVVVTALTLSIIICRRSALPDRTCWIPAIWLLPFALLIAVTAELFIVPPTMWATKLIGSNAKVCLIAIPLLAAPVLTMTLLALRDGAPASPARAGAMAGFAASAMAGLIYGFHCFDDSPLFVATWYSLASIPVVLAGALVGHRLLRW